LTQRRTRGQPVGDSAWRGWWLFILPVVGAMMWYMGLRLVLGLVS
jgi:hypothetical protein